MSGDWLHEFEHRVQPALPLVVRVATLDNENLYVGDQQTWHFNTMSAWRIREPETLIVGWTWPNASELVQRLSGLSLVRVTLQSERVPVDPLLLFDNGWILEVFGDHYLDPWTLNLPNAVLVGDGQLAARRSPRRRDAS